VLLAALVAGAGGATAYAAQTAATAHQGSVVSAGPSTGSGSGGPGGPGGAQGGPGRDGSRPGQAPDGQASDTQAPSGQAPSGPTPPADGAGGTGGAGGPGGVSTSAELTSLLTSAGTRWSAATVSAQSASSMELTSGTAVMAIGGFTGSDAAPTLAQFQAYVAAGDVHWFVGGQGGGPGGPGGGGDSTGSQISAWVQATFTSTTVGGTTVYDLTSPITG
jgi:hypothetical protein